VNKKKKDRHLKDNHGNAEFPDVSRNFVEAMDALFPEQSADLQWSDRDVWYKSGQRSVIKFLQQKLKEQEENII